MKDKELILQARDLHAWYGSSHVLHGVSLDIARGETVGLLGRNGMGKSTLIRTLLGHVGQREGQIVIAGHDLSRARPHEVARRGVAYVPEGRGVFPNLSVKENLAMAARPGAAGDLPAGSRTDRAWPARPGIPPRVSIFSREDFPAEPPEECAHPSDVVPLPRPRAESTS